MSTFSRDSIQIRLFRVCARAPHASAILRFETRGIVYMEHSLLSYIANMI
jgi:hypothetical protein